MPKSIDIAGMKPGKLTLVIECTLLFGLIPGLLLWFQLHQNIPFFPVLFGFLSLTLLIGWRDPNVSFRPQTQTASPKKLILRIAAAAIGLTLLTALFYPPLLFRLPRERPQLWLMVMLLYPLLSVAPQEFLFRTFFMQRYRPVFGEGATMLWVNALAFAWAHIFFLNLIAPILSLIAGLLLAHTWQKNRSFRTVCLEHALYGQIVFTCGIGWFFYQGSTAAIQQMTP